VDLIGIIMAVAVLINVLLEPWPDDPCEPEGKDWLLLQQSPTAQAPIDRTLAD
jgi:hypothetical protein